MKTHISIFFATMIFSALSYAHGVTEPGEIQYNWIGDDWANSFDQDSNTFRSVINNNPDNIFIPGSLDDSIADTMDGSLTAIFDEAGSFLEGSFELYGTSDLFGIAEYGLLAAGEITSVLLESLDGESFHGDFSFIVNEHHALFDVPLAGLWSPFMTDLGPGVTGDNIFSTSWGPAGGASFSHVIFTHPSAVPEPFSLGLLALGLIILSLSQSEFFNRTGKSNKT